MTAVEQGRIIYANILRFIHFLFSCNFSEIATIVIAVAVGWPLPLAPLQILWLNIVTDVFPASAPDVMKGRPRDPAEPLLSRRFAWLIAWQGLLLAGATLAAFAAGMRWHGTDGDGLRHAMPLPSRPWPSCRPSTPSTRGRRRARRSRGGCSATAGSGPRY